jgi:hypothetical protein
MLSVPAEDAALSCHGAFPVSVRGRGDDLATSPGRSDLQKVRGLVAAVLVGAPLAAFLMFWLHATREFAGLCVLGIGLAIFAVVATRSDAHDEAADLAWQAAAPDLPPVSDRVALERTQAVMLGPSKKKATPRPAGESATGTGHPPGE